MTRPLQLAACLALAALPFAALAQESAAAPEPADSTGAGSAENGRMLAYTCQGCHGVTNYVNAYPNYRVPKIGGQSQEYLINALTEYKRGTRRHPTMQAQANSFSDQDIADIAAFLSSLNQ
ncbi:c-type cytochrome [Luteimonas suaedae]|uniref:c-type cytochrome n=1 Tax=Luteimonas suaedae TaxID=2605430 RepID=UPI0011EDF58E|nr:cytochrome c [Luteimonas suaedae]